MGAHGARVETARWEKPAKGQGWLVGDSVREKESREDRERKRQMEKEGGKSATMREEA